MLPNRRKKGHPRFPVRVPAATQRPDAWDRLSLGETQDLSRGGMLLRLDHAIAPGTPVQVSLHLRRRVALRMAGRVVWSRPHPDLPGWAIGVEFDEVIAGDMVAEIADEEQPPWRVSLPRAGATPQRPSRHKAAGKRAE